MIKVLHITPWYPEKDTLSGIFVREHIDSIESYVQQSVIHLDVSSGENWEFIKERRLNFQKLLLKVPFGSWKLIEIFHSLLLFRLLLKHKGDYDLINFHIAYPNLRFWWLIKKFIKKPVLCIEHWSIYGQNFGLKRNKKSDLKLKGVRKIFYQDQITFLAVSNHLATQLRNFSGNQNLKVSVLPNVVNDHFIYRKSTNKPATRFVMASVWRTGKRPLEVIRAFSYFIKDFPDSKLIIAGDGPLIPEMKNLVELEKLKRNVEFLGIIDKKLLAIELNKANALIHSSDHETFSAICAESLCTGTPILISPLPAVLEYMMDTDGIVVTEHTSQCWYDAMILFQKNQHSFNPAKIAQSAQAKFSKNAVGKVYFEQLNATYEDSL